MKVNMTHNENIKIFSNISYHIELEDERLKAVRPGAHVYVTKSNFKKFSSFKRKWCKSKKMKKIVQGLMNKNKQFKFKRGKCTEKRDNTKMTCYSYDKKGHFAYKCTKPKKVLSHSILNYKIYISNIVLLTISHPMWTIDSRVIDCITSNIRVIVKFCRIPRVT